MYCFSKVAPVAKLFFGIILLVDVLWHFPLALANMVCIVLYKEENGAVLI